MTSSPAPRRASPPGHLRPLPGRRPEAGRAITSPKGGHGRAPAALPLSPLAPPDDRDPVDGPLYERLAADGARVAVLEILDLAPWEPSIVGRAWPPAEGAHLVGRPLWAAIEAGFTPVHPTAAAALRRRLDALEDTHVPDR
jgi:hypothetical protein